MQFLKNPGIIIRVAIAVAYILLGILVIFTPLSTILSDKMKYVFSILLIAYGIFRCYRAYQLYKDVEESK